MKIRKGGYEVEGTPIEVAELLRHLENPAFLDTERKSFGPGRKITSDDIWGIREDSLRDFVHHHPWSGPGEVAEHFFGRTVYSTGDDKSLYYTLYRRIGDARRFWNQTQPGWNSERNANARTGSVKDG